MNAVTNFTRMLAVRRTDVGVHRDRDWLIPMVAITAIQLALWCSMWLAGMAAPPMFATYNWIAVFGLSVVGVPLFLGYLYRINRAGEQRPLARIRADTLQNARRFAAILIAVQVIALSSSAFSAMKAAMPSAVPFYLDPALTDLERFIFGTDPWRASHALLGWATPLIDRIYLLWLPTLMVVLYAVLLARPSALKTRALISHALLWPLIGTIAAYASSSAGPIFHERLFGAPTGLTETLRQNGATGNLLAYEKLWASHSDNSPLVGGGISAMPSMHIAMAVWIALVVRSAYPRFAWIGWSYLGVIWLGSVHLGWHYVLDGVPGALGALAIWQISSAYPRNSHRSHAALAAA